MSSRRELTRTASSNLRTGAAARSSVRPGTRTSNLRYQHGPSQTQRPASPAESVASVATNATKRKEREYDFDTPGQETNINVVVRCRGRNDREVKENSAVVVQADGAKGKNVELKLGPNALSNKTYNFDRVFSAAADQTMVFDDTVKPILDEVRLGCDLANENWLTLCRCSLASTAQSSPTVRPVRARHTPCLVT